MVYRGPIRLPTSDGLDQRVVRQNLSITQELASNASGVITGYVTGNDVSASADFASFEDVYQEFRILGLEMRWIPYYNGSYNATRTPSAGAAAVIHVPTTAAPTTMGEVTDYPTWKPFKSSSQLVLHWKMRGVEEAPFISTSTPSGANHGGLIWYLPGLTASQPYGRVVYTWLVEFRGRR